MRLPATAYPMFAAIIGVLAIIGGLIVAGADGSTADSFSVDLDATGNTSTALGTRDECREVSANDTFDIDITVAGVPSGTLAMMGYNYEVSYDASVFSVTAKNTAGLLSTATGYTEFDAGDSVPDADGTFIASVLDLGATGVSGSGFMQRLAIHVDAAAAPGSYPLAFVTANSPNYYLDTLNHSRNPLVLFGARLAVDVTCASLGTPPPSPTPNPNTQDDVDCNGAVTAVDALKVLRYTINLSVSQVEPCTDIGAPTASGFKNGDVDCDNDVDPVDTLRLLRYIAGLSVYQIEPCPDIGT